MVGIGIGRLGLSSREFAAVVGNRIGIRHDLRTGEGCRLRSFTIAERKGLAIDENRIIFFPSEFHLTVRILRILRKSDLGKPFLRHRDGDGHLLRLRVRALLDGVVNRRVLFNLGTGEGEGKSCKEDKTVIQNLFHTHFLLRLGFIIKFILIQRIGLQILQASGRCHEALLFHNVKE